MAFEVLEKIETRTDVLLKKFIDLSKKIGTDDFITEIKMMKPKDFQELRIAIREDFLELNTIFNSADNADKKRIATAIGSFFDKLNNYQNYTDPSMDAFLSSLIPDRNYIQSYRDKPKK